MYQQKLRSAIRSSIILIAVVVSLSPFISLSLSKIVPSSSHNGPYEPKRPTRPIPPQVPTL